MPVQRQRLGIDVSTAAEKSSVSALVEQLRWQAGLPISFVEALASPKVQLPFRKATAEAALKEILRQAPNYRCELLHGHMVLYPEEPRYQQVFKAPRMEGLPRYTAARRFVEDLAEESRDFSNLSGPLMWASLEFPVFGDSVSMGGRDSVLGHFARLLGTNPTVFFTVSKGSSGSLSFELGAQDRRRALQGTTMGEPCLLPVKEP